MSQGVFVGSNVLRKGEGELDAMDCARWEYIDLVDDSNIPKCFLDWGFKAAAWLCGFAASRLRGFAA